MLSLSAGICFVIAWLLTRPILGSFEDIRQRTSSKVHIFLFGIMTALGIVAEKLTIMQLGESKVAMVPIVLSSMLVILGIQMIFRSARFGNRPIIR